MVRSLRFRTSAAWHVWQPWTQHAHRSWSQHGRLSRKQTFSDQRRKRIAVSIGILQRDESREPCPAAGSYKTNLRQQRAPRRQLWPDHENNDAFTPDSVWLEVYLLRVFSPPPELTLAHT